jgi:hypothetical protein
MEPKATAEQNVGTAHQFLRKGLSEPYWPMGRIVGFFRINNCLKTLWKIVAGRRCAFPLHGSGKFLFGGTGFPACAV